MRTSDNVLVRKLQHRSVARSPLPDTDFLGQALASEIEKEFRPLVKTIVSAMVLECRIMKISDALKDIPVPAMLGLIDIEPSKVQGLLHIDNDLTYHMIDLMLGGDPSAVPIPITRTYTVVDLALMRIPKDAMMGAFVSALAACFGRPYGSRVAIAAQRQDITQVRIAPEHVDVLVYLVTLDIGPAARTGNMHLVLPLATLDAVSHAMKEEAAETTDDSTNDLWKVQMRRAAATAPIAVKAILHRQRMSIAALQALKPGDLLEIPASAPEEVQLLLALPGGKTGQLASGRLGAYQGSKVVKIETAPDPRFRDYIRRLL